MPSSLALGPPAIVIRADASKRIGHGHVTRTLNLAEGLQKKGARVAFVCRTHDGHLGDEIARRGFPVHLLPAASKPAHGTDTGSVPSADTAYATWLGAPWMTDADQTIAAIHALSPAIGRPDWVVVDHYAIDHRWESRVGTVAPRVLVIDDLADRRHACDLLLDQNLVARMTERYDPLLAAESELLLGPKFALVADSYRAARAVARPRSGAIKRVLIALGGGEVGDLTARCLAAACAALPPGVAIDVVVTRAAAAAVRAAADSRVTLHHDLPDLAGMMACADLAIGGGGMMNWERLCVGLPALVLSVAANQRPIAEALAMSGLVRHLGDAAAVSAQTIRDVLAEFVSRGLDPRWSIACSAVVDGLGVERVCAALLADRNSSLRARPARVGDEALMLRWANDPETRRRAFNPAQIDRATHHDWFAARLSDGEGCHLWIIEIADAVPVGQVRFQHHAPVPLEAEAYWEVHYAMSSPFRGRGLGTRLLGTALDALAATLRSPVRIIGQVRLDNVASQRVFHSLGFTARPRDIESPDHGERVIYDKLLYPCA